MNRALLNPFEASDLPRTIKGYLNDEEKVTCLRFNRHGNLLAGGTISGQVIVWDFDTKTVATRIPAPRFVHKKKNAAITETINVEDEDDNKRNSGGIKTNSTAEQNGKTGGENEESDDEQMDEDELKLNEQVQIELAEDNEVNLRQQVVNNNIINTLNSSPTSCTITTGGHHTSSNNINIQERQQLVQQQQQQGDDKTRRLIIKNSLMKNSNKIVSITFLAPCNGSVIAVAYENGLIRIFDTLSVTLICQFHLYGCSLHQVEAHPKIQSLLIVVPNTGLPLLLHLRRGFYHIHISKLSSLHDPDTVVSAFAISKSPELPIPPPAPKTTFANKIISSLESPAKYMKVSLLCTGDEWIDRNKKLVPEEISSATIPPSGRKRALFCITFSRYRQRILRTGPTGFLRAFEVKDINKGTNDDDLKTNGTNENEDDKKDEVKPKSKHRNIIAHTAHCIYTVALQSRVSARTLTVSRSDKLLVNSYDRCLRLYDIRDIDRSAIRHLNDLQQKGTNANVTETVDLVNDTPGNSNNQITIIDDDKQPDNANKDKVPKIENVIDGTNNDNDGDVIMISSTSTSSRNNKKKNGKLEPLNVLPQATFSEIVNRSQCRCAAFSLDGDFILGGVDGPQHRINIWRVQDGQIDVTLEGPKEGINQILIHPLRSVIISLGSTKGGIYIWDKEVSENWSAFSTQFSELQANEEYVEKEDEFDIYDNEDNDQKDKQNKEELSNFVDITGPFRPGWFDSDSEEESYFYVPAKPIPDIIAGTPLLMDALLARREEEMGSEYDDSDSDSNSDSDSDSDDDGDSNNDDENGNASESDDDEDEGDDDGNNDDDDDNNGHIEESLIDGGDGEKTSSDEEINDSKETSQKGKSKRSVSRKPRGERGKKIISDSSKSKQPRPTRDEASASSAVVVIPGTDSEENGNETLAFRGAGKSISKGQKKSTMSKSTRTRNVKKRRKKNKDNMNTNDDYSNGNDSVDEDEDDEDHSSHITARPPTPPRRSNRATSGSTEHNNNNNESNNNRSANRDTFESSSQDDMAVVVEDIVIDSGVVR